VNLPRGGAGYKIQRIERASTLTEVEFKGRCESCREPGIKNNSGPAKSGPTLYFPFASFFRRFPAATRSELAIHCALNRIDESKDIQ
jgi:hypothetical protein